MADKRQIGEIALNFASLAANVAAQLARHPWRVMTAALVLTAVACLGVARIPIYTSREAVLPKDAEVSQRLERFLDKFGAASDLIVVLDGGREAPLSSSEMESFATDLAARLRQQATVRQAVERVDLMFFFERAYLLVPPKQLRQFDSVMQRLVGLPGPARLPGWDEGFRRIEGWLDDPGPLSDVDIDLQTAEEALHLVHFFLEEWQRWLDSPDEAEGIPWQKFLTRHGAGALASGRGYFTSHDKGMYFLFVRPSNSSGEIQAVAPFIKEVRREGEALRRAYMNADRRAPKVALAGLPAVTFEEITTIRRDILFTASSAGLLILLLIALWLRSMRWAITIFGPMGLGVLWNTGLAYVVQGHLTILTAGFTAILFGLGVDYGIFLSSRILEERKDQTSLVEAVARGVGSSWGPLTTAAGATVLIFVAMTTVPLSGFAELGAVAASGVALVFGATFFMQPALFALLRPSRSAATSGQDPGFMNREDPSWRPMRSTALLLVMLAVVAAVGGSMAGLRIPFNHDAMDMLPRDSEAAHYQQRMLQESDYQGEVLIFTAPSIAEARIMARKAAELSSLAQIQSVTELFPESSEVRVRLARNIGRLIAESGHVKQILELGPLHLAPETVPRLHAALGKTEVLLEDAEELAFSAGHEHLVRLFEKILSQLERVKERLGGDTERARLGTQRYAQTILDAARGGFEVLTRWQNAQRLSVQDLPPMLADRFFAPDGTVALYGFPTESVYNLEYLDTLMADVYGVSKEVTGFPTTHHVFSRMVFDSFSQATLLGLLFTVIWISLVLRNVRGAVIALLPLLVGGGWMMGLHALWGIKFTYSNIVALPLVMGLAVDYGVWFAHRRNELARLPVWRVALIAGRAIALAGGTTLAGLGAIMFAKYRGVQSMGVSVTTGLMCCVVAALLISPAITQLMYRRDE